MTLMPRLEIRSVVDRVGGTELESNGSSYGSAVLC